MNEQEIAERIGRLADTADNYAVYGTKEAFAPPAVCLEAMSNGLGEIAAELKELYVELTGQDPWQQ